MKTTTPLAAAPVSVALAGGVARTTNDEPLSAEAAARVILLAR